jgi:hypothetical protein
VPRQAVSVRLVPEADDGALQLSDAAITSVRARVQKGVDGYALVFVASVGPISARDLEYLVGWHTLQRFVTFHPQEPVLDFAANPAPRQRPRRVQTQ